jgi:CheY-like chemotaxis protein
MKQILIIDDDPFVTTLYKTKLQSEGFLVDTAHNGMEALGKLDQGFSPDVIILDLNMPEMNGVEVLQSIRNAPKFRQIPIVVFSSGYVRTLVEKVSQLGVNKFLTKAQCPPNVLISEIKELLSQKPSAPVSALAADAAATPGNPVVADIPALLQMFISAQVPSMQHTVLLRIYKASRKYLCKAIEEGAHTMEGKLGRILETLIEDLYAHPEQITDSTKHTLEAGFKKLEQLEKNKVNPVQKSEQALKDLLQSGEDD